MGNFNQTFFSSFTINPSSNIFLLTLRSCLEMTRLWWLVFGRFDLSVVRKVSKRKKEGRRNDLRKYGEYLSKFYFNGRLEPSGYISCDQEGIANSERWARKRLQGVLKKKKQSCWVELKDKANGMVEVKEEKMLPGRFEISETKGNIK